MSKLHSTLQAGELALKNRIVMAPLTRTRAGPTHVPNALMAEYYAQRASAGLVMTECSMVAADASAFMGEGGIFNAETVAGWRRVTDAVHAKGGLIMIQIWHPGRATHEAINGGVQPVSSSAHAIREQSTHTPKGKLPYPVPRALATAEIPGIVAAFRAAAKAARAAGFDGVQIHGAHGYLVDQFLRDSLNDRSDDYGGSIANRARLLLEVIDAVSAEIGAGRVAVRISPLVGFNDMSDSDPEALTAYVAEELSKRHLAFFELRHEDWKLPRERALAELARKHYKGVLMRNGGFDQAAGEEAVGSGAADAIVYGKAFIANPDLVERFAGKDAPLNAVDFGHLYTPGPVGYTDYPALEAASA